VRELQLAVRKPAVISFNTTVAGAAVTGLLRMVTGFAGGQRPPDRLSFSFATGTVRRTRLPAGTSCRICGAPEAADTEVASRRIRGSAAGRRRRCLQARQRYPLA
jgi:hypothetical protein